MLITAELTKAIVNQEDDVSSINHVAVQQAEDFFRKSKEENMKQNKIFVNFYLETKASIP